MGMGMGLHGEWQTRNDSLTIRECHSLIFFGFWFVMPPHSLVFLVFGLLCRHTVSESITPESHTSGAQ